MNERDRVHIESINEYIKTHFGEYPPYDFVDDNGLRIGAWLIDKSSRLKIGSVPDEEVMQLRETGLLFGVKLLLWRDWYELLVQYFTTGIALLEPMKDKEHQKSDLYNYINTTYLVDQKYALGKWAERQVRNYWDLSDEQRALLNKLPWDKIQKVAKKKPPKKHIELLNSREQEFENSTGRWKQKREAIYYNLAVDAGYLRGLEVEITKVQCSNTTTSDDGFTVYVKIHNLQNVSVDIKIIDFVLLNNGKEVRFDSYKKGHFAGKCTILPGQFRETAGYFSDERLRVYQLRHGDKVVMSVRDISLSRTYWISFEFDSFKWKKVYATAKRFSTDTKRIERKIQEYYRIMEKGLITERDFNYIKTILLGIIGN